MTIQNYARCGADNIVIETWAPPASMSTLIPSQVFDAVVAPQFVPCPNDVSQLWIHDPIANTWTAPIGAPPTQ
jgi:hypothetical protein